jgi:RNA polymerase sigma-70 factor, ECF subfamily
VSTAAATLSRLEPMDEDLVRLVRAAQKDDRAAFAELYRRYASTIHGIVLSRVSTLRADVEDIVQDVFLTAMQRISALREPAAFGGWLAAIARNHALDCLRRAPRTSELPDDVADAQSDGAQANRADALAIMKIIRTLPDAYRETLILRLVEGMTGPEIAARTGLTEGSVRVNLHRGMKQLRDRLEL